MKKYIFYFSIALLAFSCQNEIQIDPESGAQIKVQSEGLSYKDVEIEVNGKKSELKVFDYGDEITLNFVNVEGFIREKGKIYPGLKLLVLNKQGDSLLYYDDMYADQDPVGKNPVTLTASMIAAKPMRTGEILRAKLDFWDKKGKGKMHVDFEFSTKSNDNITVKSQKIEYNEIYIFSEKTGRVITDNQYDNDDMLYFILEGLKGFNEQNGVIYPCLMLDVKNEKGEIILHQDNILQAYYEDGVSKDAVEEKIYFGLGSKALTQGKKLSIHAVLVDRISDASLIMDTEISLKK
ncbi:MAG: hypothetical protein K0R65_1685 [Crocinitomicaceae bacterium]|jgi:hypothetical protein|nr:hypothetical protein [Crocinitomicaceae bacterium]